ncbi:MAG: nickel pincer cofactor biosynthesis protein LarC [Candidatus Rokubacteria bacterium]|nr:nickel pincer cofactor biosynthesis protein LarC [Candidatus Rokubacteria bacterium]
MKVLYFDCPAGASGDMILGALVDAGLSVDALRAELASLPLGGWRLESRPVMRGAFRATKVDVHVDEHRHAHPHHRGLADVLAILRAGTLAPAALADAERVFTRLADAEARAHGSTREAVHFHDVGAVDAIVDVAGACVGLALLGIERVHASALPVGGGFVDGPHGRIPVPAPGTAELLRGWPVVDTGVRAELVTPTGAAIVTTLATPGPMPAMTIGTLGYGAGTRDPAETANVLRCLVGDAAGEADDLETIVQAETTIDDMSPQLYEPLMERLLAAGALDVFLTPVIMKRSRPAVVVTVLCAPAAIDVMADALFQETSTIGVRWSEWRRKRLPREMVTLTTTYGPVPFKVSRLDGRVVTVTPEFADVVRIAREKGRPVRDVLDQVRAEGLSLL